MEPSHAARKVKTDPVIDPNIFPFKYHDQPHIRRLLGEGEEGNASSVWDEAVHVIGLRHPLDMAMSAFHYVFQPDRFSMLDRCHAWNLTVNECLTAAMDLAEQPPGQTPLHAVYQHYTLERMKNASRVNTPAYYQELRRILAVANTTPLPIALNMSRLRESPPDTPQVETTLGNIRNYQAQMRHLRRTFHAPPSNASSSPPPPTGGGWLPKWWQRLLSQPLFDVWQQHRIRHQVFGNYSIQHLSLDNQLEDAKQV